MAFQSTTALDVAEYGAVFGAAFWLHSSSFHHMQAGCEHLGIHEIK